MGGNGSIELPFLLGEPIEDRFRCLTHCQHLFRYVGRERRIGVHPPQDFRFLPVWSRSPHKDKGFPPRFGNLGRRVKLSNHFENFRRKRAIWEAILGVTNE